MSSSKEKAKELDINLGRGAAGLHIGSEKARGPGIIGPGLGVGATTIGTTGLATGVAAGQQYAQQTTLLVSNDPTTVVSQEQRLASNQPVITEKHISKEYVPVVHEEIVTTVPIVTGQAVHTGQAIAGEKYVQPINVEYVKQQAATKIDLMPQVQTQLGPQEVVNVPINQAPHLVGRTTVLPAQQTMTTATSYATGFPQTQAFGTGAQVIGTQPLGAQVFGTQPLGAQVLGTQTYGTTVTGTQPFGAQGLGTQPFGAQGLGTQHFGAQGLGTQPFGAQGLGTQPFGAQVLGTQPFGTTVTGTQPLSTPLNAQTTGLGGPNINIGLPKRI